MLKRAGGDALEAGFTLIELMITVGVAAIVLAILTPSIRQATSSFELRRGASVTMSELRRAQTLAMTQDVDYTVEFYTSTSGTPGGIKVWKAGDVSPSRTILTPDWPRSVQMQDSATTLPACVAPASTSHKCVVFRPLGYPAQDGLVRLVSGTGTTMNVVVAPATGRVSVQ